MLSIGNRAERRAARFLSRRQVTILTSNYRTPRGEIDLVALDQAELVFVEVRYRARPEYGDGIESVTTSKQAAITRAAEHYLAYHPNYQNRICRFDVVGMSGPLNNPEITWIKNAFAP